MLGNLILSLLGPERKRRRCVNDVSRETDTEIKGDLKNKAEDGLLRNEDRFFLERARLNKRESINVCGLVISVRNKTILL